MSHSHKTVSFVSFWKSDPDPHASKPPSAKPSIKPSTHRTGGVLNPLTPPYVRAFRRAPFRLVERGCGSCSCEVQRPFAALDAHLLPVSRDARERTGALEHRNRIAQRGRGDVCIVHGHRDGRVAEQVLDRGERDASGGESRREGVPQRVPADGADARSCAHALQGVLGHAEPEGLAARSGENQGSIATRIEHPIEVCRHREAPDAIVLRRGDDAVHDGPAHGDDSRVKVVRRTHRGACVVTPRQGTACREPAREAEDPALDLNGFNAECVSVVRTGRQERPWVRLERT